jgi:hypothetical protein
MCNNSNNNKDTDPRFIILPNNFTGIQTNSGIPVVPTVPH